MLLYSIMVMWCTLTRVVATKKGFRGHTITVSDSSLASDVRQHISGFRERLGYAS
jgi:hypothetical protein